MGKIQFWAADSLVDAVECNLPEECTVVTKERAANGDVLLTVESSNFPDVNPDTVYPLCYQIDGQVWWDFGLPNFPMLRGRGVLNVIGDDAQAT